MSQTTSAPSAIRLVLAGESSVWSFPCQRLGFSTRRGVGEQDGPAQRQNVAIAGFGGGGSGAGLGDGKGTDDLRRACGDGGIECGRHAVALHRSGENDGDGRGPAQQYPQDVAFDGGMETANYR
jgi:hypothetical protein